MTMYTGYTQCPVCGYRYPAQTTTVTTGTSTKDEYVRVVRCKDCKYWQDNNGGYPHDDCKWNSNETPDPDDYCSGAERKEE